MTTEATSTHAPAAPASATDLPGDAAQAPGTSPAAAAPAPDALELPESKPAEQAPATTESPQTYTYSPSGDPGLDLALDFVGNLGFGPEHPAIQAAENGDFAALREALKGLGDKAKGWEKVLAAGEAAFQRIDAEHKARAEKTVAAIHEIAGGPEQWQKVQAWAGENATPDERNAVNAALKQGGLVAKAVARELTALYLKQPTAEKPAIAARSTAAPVAQAPGSDALSPRAYTAEVSKLKAQLGSRMEGSREYAALQARRQAWRS